MKYNVIPIIPCEGIANKYFVDRLAIEIIPFYSCNLSCSFCKFKNFSNEYYDHVFDDMVKCLTNSIKYYHSKFCTLHVCGGELFQYESSDYFDQLTKFYNDLQNIAKQNNRIFAYEITSNLIVSSDCRDRILKLIKQFNIVLTTSFDLVGRFPNDQILNQWLDNVYWFREIGIPINISVIGHKLNWSRLKDTSHKMTMIFDQLTKDFDVTLVEYVDSNNLHNYRLTNKELGEMFNWFVDHYPNIAPFKQIIENIKSNRVINIPDRCETETLDINQTATTWNCCDKDKLIKNIITHNQCYQCKYQKYCAVNCPLQYSIGDICHYKMNFQYIDKKYNG